MALDRKVIVDLLEKAFIGADIKLTDYEGDSNHYELEIKHRSFVGLSKIQQHRLVYDALGKYVGNELHAISIKSSIN